MKKTFLYLIGIVLLVSLAGCKHEKEKYVLQPDDTIALAKCPQFDADSAMAKINDQCAFGPRVTGTEASQKCGDWIVAQFKALGYEVTEQKTEATIYDGTKVPMRNIIASINPDSLNRILVCAHWDCRPWADNDPDESKHHTPILAANDAASGVAVMLEMARVMKSMPLKMGVDFVCFDAEDMGTPEWAENDSTDTSDTWCLGSQYWANQAFQSGYAANYGILLDMVGGKGSTFAKEGVSMYYAQPVVDKVWQLAKQLGYQNIFQDREGGQLIDDHVPVCQVAQVNCIDIVPNYQTGEAFGPTWHTVSDTPENIDPNVLKAVGQTVLQMIYNDNAE